MITGKLLGLVVAGALLASASAFAQDYPTRPIKFIVGAAPGSVTDLVPRILGQEFSERLGWNTTIDYKPGGDYIIGTQAAVDAAPDGYTLYQAVTPNTILPYSHKTSFDFMRDLAPITRTTVVQSAFGLANNIPAKNIQELIAWSKANPGKISGGASGANSPLRFAFEAVKLKTGMDGQYIAYKSGSVALADVLGGSLPIALTGVGNLAQPRRDGKLKIVLIMSQNRNSIFPDIPTMKDLGVEATGDAWFGFMTRAGTPAPIIARLHKEIVAILQLPDVKAQFNKAGLDTLYDASPEAFRKYLETEIAIWGDIIKKTGMKFQ